MSTPYELYFVIAVAKMLRKQVELQELFSMLFLSRQSWIKNN
jgi:hypothetical protein